MYLINTATLQLHEFNGYENLPPYAILSHRWETGEVDFRRFQDGTGPELKGWSKIKGCCALAQSNGLAFAWIDTCCIDKTSSAELSEAVNSMFGLYTRAEICYAYLCDVRSNFECDVNDRQADLSGQFTNSVWFTRGWTLQELLAPEFVVFYDCDWNKIGTKDSLQQELSSITGIKADHLEDPLDASVAQKMSWASERVTTRVEDMAYCLLGLFNVSMPLLYGEGTKAFRRLQLEIVKESTDESIFAWNLPSTLTPENNTLPLNFRKVLADSPAAFKNSGQLEVNTWFDERGHYQMTNRGLQIKVLGLSNLAVVANIHTHNRAVIMLLNCAFTKATEPICLILLRSVYESDGSWRIVNVTITKVRPSETQFLSLEQGSRKTIYIEDH